MKTLFIGSLCLVLVFCSPPFTVSAQDGARVFTLPDVRAGETYQVNLEALLRDRYRLRLETASKNAVLQWALAEGELPLGFAVRTDGTISGTSQDSRPQNYRFRLKVIDTTVPDETLALDFVLSVKAAGLRLVKINAPALVPLEGDFARDNGASANTASTDNNDLPATARPADLAKPSSNVSTPQEGGVDMSWKEPEVPNGRALPYLTQSPLSLAIDIKPVTQACLLNVLVLRQTATGLDNEVVHQQKKEVDLSKVLQRFQVNVAEGNNHVVVTPYKKKNDNDKCDSDTNLDSLKVAGSELTLIAQCKGENCKVQPAAANSDLTGPRMRAILGIEQSGASSAASAQNPFVDFFFNAPLPKNKWLVWGDIRLTTTPQQVAAFASSATNAVAAATADKINDLATSFDFKIGPEFQFNPKADTRLSLIAGFGAISTLTGPPKGSPIFKLPANTSTQYANFVSQYPEALTAGATHIAFVPQEQDRFYRQYFAGFRVRSYHGKQFPSMFDVTFGQNSAVTEGKLRHFVLGFEGSHHIPLLKNAIYIFGSANLKVGGPKFRSTPFVLDPADATVKLSDPTVVITSRQSNRDFYRLGFGIDLIELFKPSDKKQE
jgi:hypothetical protein